MLIFFSSQLSSTAPSSIGDPAPQTPSHLKFLGTFSFAFLPQGLNLTSSIPIPQFWHEREQLNQTNPLEDCMVIFIWGNVIQGRKGQGLTCQLQRKEPHSMRFLWDSKPDLPQPAQSRLPCRWPGLSGLSTIGFFLSLCPRTSRSWVSQCIYSSVSLLKYYAETLLPHLIDVLDVSVVSPTFLLIFFPSISDNGISDTEAHCWNESSSSIRHFHTIG